MSKIKAYIEKSQDYINQMIALEEEYRGKTKGEVYQRKYSLLLGKLGDIQNRLKKIGTDTEVWEVKAWALTELKTGIQKTYNYKFYFSAIDLLDVQELMSIVYKNFHSISIEPVKLGKPIPVKEKF